MRTRPQRMLTTAILDEVTKQRNRMTESEFSQFTPLFSSTPNLTFEELQKLATEWRMKVSLYDPVEIIDNNGTVVRTLAPSLIDVNTLNTIDSEGRVLNALISEIKNDSKLNPRVAQIGEAICKIVDKSNPEEVQERKVEVGTKIAEANGHAVEGPTFDNVEVEDALKDAEWS